MRLMLSICTAFAFTLLFSLPDAHAARRGSAAAPTGCTKVLGLGSCLYKNSKPHRACTRVDCPIDYFERHPSLLVNSSGIPSKGSAKLIDANGGYLATCQRRECRDCSKGFRYVCVGDTNAFARKAKRKANSYTVYYKIGGVCVTIPDIGRCVGSVKGLCNQVLH